MRLRPGQLWMSVLICLGCHGLAGQAVPFAKPSGRDAPGRNHLTLAAGCLEKGDEIAACEHLGLYLQDHPAHRSARWYHAELLLKLGRTRQARGEFELGIRHELDQVERDLPYLVRCHTRVVEIAASQGAEYVVHLHRGIGMLILAQQRASLADPDGAAAVEGLLFKATAQLARAHALRPSEARPCWYLHLAWRQLAQQGPSRRYLAEAQRRAAYSDLAPAERRDLLLACRERLPLLSL